MKKALCISSVLFLLALLLLPPVVFAHSGNTDDKGGHYVGGTGEYHYHHGWPAHYHKNGVCPYEDIYEESQTDHGDTTSDHTSDVWITFGVLIGIPVLILVIALIYARRLDAKKRSAAIIPDFMVWYSPSGSCYHSSKTCSVLRNSKHLLWATNKTNTSSLYDRKPCSKCCYMKDGKVFPQEQSEPKSDMPEMVSVVSSNLKEVGYQRGTLYVHFHNGSLYRYDNVPQRLAEQLMMSRSADKFFNKHIRDRYDYEYISIP